MKDVTALMGKLKSTVAYLQTDESASQTRPWPVLERAAQVREAELAQALAEPVPAAAAPPHPSVKAHALILRRYGPAPEAPPPSRALADIFAHLERVGR